MIGHTRVLFGLGNLFLVIAITTVTNHLVDFEIQNEGATRVAFNGTAIGAMSAFLLCAYLILMWVKFQYFSQTFKVPPIPMLLGAVGTCLAALAYAISALFCMASDFCQGTLSGMMASHVLALGCLIHLGSDSLLIAKSADYEDRLRRTPDHKSWQAFNVATGVYSLRGMVLVFLVVLSVSRSFDAVPYNNEIVEAIFGLDAAKVRVVHLLLVLGNFALPLVLMSVSWIPEARFRAGTSAPQPARS